MESDLQVMFLSSRAAMSAPATGTAWVTSMATGKPVQGANVNIYVRRSGKVCIFGFMQLATITRTKCNESYLAK